ATISDPKIQRWIDNAWLLYANYTGSEMMAETSKVQPIRFQVELLRIWLLRNRERDDADIVLEHALGTLIAATDVTPSATVPRDLSAPLPFIADLQRRRHCVTLLDGHLASAAQYGPTVDYVDLVLRMARAECAYDETAARQRFANILKHSETLEDVGV